MSGPDGFELPRLLGDLERRLCERLAGRLSAVGSSLNEWRVLAQLVEGPGKAMSDVAGLLNIPASSATKLVDAWNVYEIAAVGERVFISMGDLQEDYELWVSDG